MPFFPLIQINPALPGSTCTQGLANEQKGELAFKWTGNFILDGDAAGTFSVADNFGIAGIVSSSNTTSTIGTIQWQMVVDVQAFDPNAPDSTFVDSGTEFGKFFGWPDEFRYDRRVLGNGRRSSMSFGRTRRMSHQDCPISISLRTRLIRHFRMTSFRFRLR